MPARDPREDADEGEPVRIAAAKPVAAPDDHHPLDAEVEDAGPLHDQLAERRDEQRRRGGDDGEEDRFEHAHQAALAGATSRRR
jgi:hypothetical protein